MKISDVMTPNPITCKPDDSVQEAARIMKQEDIGPLPIIDESRKLVGIVTDRDLTIKVLAEGRDAKSTRVADVMTRDPITCNVDSDLQEVLDAMKDHQVRRIPIVDEQDHIVGILAQADVATRYNKDKQTGQVVEEISKLKH